MEERLLENQRWQEVPGCPDAKIYPVIHKPDVSCSNSYLLQTAEALVLIDPGGDPKQTTILLEAAAAQLYEKSRPVLVLFTHCHRDHTWQTPAIRAGLSGSPVHVLAHEAGMRAFQERDRDITLAYMYREEVPEMGAMTALLAREDLDAQEAREVEVCPGVRLQTNAPAERNGHDAPGEEKDAFLRQRLAIGTSVFIDILPIPGHTPDSVAFLAGGVIFSGDLLLAANPGVAGIPGWSQPDLLRSIDAAICAIEARHIEICCTGHGPMLPAAKAAKILAKSAEKARALTDLARLDEDRTKYLKHYTEAVLHEACELFSLIGGRLIAVAHHMERLEEGEEARRILAALDIKAIDAFLSDFHQYAENRKVADLDMALPLKGVQILGRIEAAFNETALKGLIDLSLIRRARNLVQDFLNTIHGLPAKDFGEPQDINFVLLSALSALARPSYRDSDIMEALDDPAAFAQALTARIAGQSQLARTALHLDARIGLPLVTIDRACLEDALVSVLERLALRKVEEIHIRTVADSAQSHVAIEISASQKSLQGFLKKEKLQFLNFTLQPFGARLGIELSAGQDVIVIHLPVGAGLI